MERNRIEILPSVQIMELMTPMAGNYDAAEVTYRLLQPGFYRAIETGIVAERKQADRLKALCRSNHVRWTCWSSVELAQEKLNLSSIDAALRQHSAERVIEWMRLAGSQQADAFAVLSGSMPEDKEQLPQAVEAFRLSLEQIARAAEDYPDMDLLVEPLDRWVHKKNVIGPTREAKRLLLDARRIHARTYMAWDSAHTALNGEDLVTSLRMAGETVRQLHLCNAVLDDEDPLYGDYHMPPGEKGYLTLLRGADTIREAAKLPLENGFLPVAVEVRPQSKDDPWKMEETIREFLREAIRLACAGR